MIQRASLTYLNSQHLARYAFLSLITSPVRRPHLHVCCVVRQQKTSVLKLWSSADGTGVLSVGSNAVRYHTRGGMLMQECKYVV
jgi:hypothetical protein